MLSFIYTYSSTYGRGNAARLHKVTIYRVKNNQPFFVAEGYDTFVSEFQLVMETMEKHKLLPKKAFARSPVTNGMIYAWPSGLEQAGIARINRVI